MVMVTDRAGQDVASAKFAAAGGAAGISASVGAAAGGKFADMKGKADMAMKVRIMAEGIACPAIQLTIFQSKLLRLR